MSEERRRLREEMRKRSQWLLPKGQLPRHVPTLESIVESRAEEWELEQEEREKMAAEDEAPFLRELCPRCCERFYGIDVPSDCG